MNKLLIVEDNNDLRENMRWALKAEFTIFEADSIQTCKEVFTNVKPSVVCLDMGLDNIPDGGLKLLDTMLKIDRLVKVIVITANTNQHLGQESVKRGAFDFFNKPVDIEQLKVVINRALRIRAFEEANLTNQNIIAPSGTDTVYSMAGKSPQMMKVFSFIQKLAQTDVNVLITGESGTGKELCARAIHYQSNRKNNNFVPINCGAIPENLIESELFGYVKGAFTGATADKEGLIASAEGGTLLLDEIGEMPKNLQVKLLRFLEDNKFQRVGDTAFITANVRIVAATNRKNLAEAGSSLREDLYYRLSEFQIDLPPLRDREDDVLIIAKKLIEKNSSKFGRPKLHLSSRAENVLTTYGWPGNVRELENKLSRASITCYNDCIEPEDLQLVNKKSITNFDYKEARESFEFEFLEALLKKCKNNISEASKLSGISRPTLYAMMKKFGIEE